MLDQVMRQEGDDERSRLFRETLAELRDHGPDSISDRALQFLRSEGEDTPAKGGGVSVRRRTSPLVRKKGR